MWIFTKDGFYSIVAVRGDASRVLVRARVRKHLEALLNRFKLDCRIVELKRADYKYRVAMKRAEWSSIACLLADGIDYSNFKGACEDDAKYSGVLHEVWYVVRKLQHD